VRAEGVLFQEMDGESVLLNMATEQYHGLNEVGTLVFDMLGDTSDPEEILAAILHRYEVEEETARHDLAELLDEMASAGLVRLDGLA